MVDVTGVLGGSLISGLAAYEGIEPGVGADGSVAFRTGVTIGAGAAAAAGGGALKDLVGVGRGVVWVGVGAVEMKPV